MTAEKNIDSLSKLRRASEGKIKRVDGFKALLTDLNIEQGFNARGAFLERSAYWEREDVKAYIDALAVSYAEAAKPGAAGKPKIAPLRVIVRDGKIFVSDGEHRFYALHRANEVYGADIEWVDVIEGEGETTERNLSLVTSNMGRDLTPIEKAVVYKRAADNGWSVEDIAKRVGKSVPHVYKLLTAIKKWDEELLVKVQSGEMAFTAAQSQYEATRKKVKKNQLDNIDGSDNAASDNTAQTGAASGTDLLTDEDDIQAGPAPSNPDHGSEPAGSKAGKSQSGKAKGISKAIADSLVSLVFGFDAKKTDTGYTLELTEQQYKAILELQEQVETELKGS